MIDFYDKIMDMVGDAETTNINGFNGRIAGKVIQYITKDVNSYCDVGFINFTLRLYITDPYLIWNAPYYINGESFEIPLNINIVNKNIMSFRVIVGPDGIPTSENQYLKIHLHNCVYFNNREWYMPDGKSIGIL